VTTLSPLVSRRVQVPTGSTTAAKPPTSTARVVAFQPAKVMATLTRVSFGTGTPPCSLGAGSVDEAVADFVEDGGLVSGVDAVLAFGVGDVFSVEMRVVISPAGAVLPAELFAPAEPCKLDEDKDQVTKAAIAAMNSDAETINVP
jgi:hypothetical protein